MKYFDWDDEKNKWLMRERGISFDLCVTHITSGRVVDIIKNHHPYEHQYVYIVEIEEYCYEIPFVEDEKKIFLKTVYPSHEATKKYLKNQYDKQ
jgi:uncharacterized DUF497 family protein